ncbi:MAG: CoA-binding protein [Bryobacterales bacterium]|nr:CoA-binding protein [Bryobacterales bacterium]
MKAAIEGFLAERSLAVVGVSQRPRGFGRIAYKELKSKGYRVFAVNRGGGGVEGDPAYPSLSSLPEPVGGAVIVVPPQETERVVRDAAAAGIRKVWMQQGSESEAAIRYCEQGGMSVVHGRCILMFARPAGFHRFHRWLSGLFGKLPK